MRIVVILLVVLAAPLGALTLLETVDEAKVGDYLVTMQGRTFTVLLVQDKDDKTITFEEVTAPEMARAAKGKSWANWIRRGAKNHSSWVAYSIDQRNGRVLQAYSYSRKGWLDTSQSNHFLTTLLRLEFQPVPPQQRKRVGSARREWTPPLVFEGRKVAGVEFGAWQARWPKDGSELAGRRVTIYLPKEEGVYPTHFPYWVEVTPAIADNKVRVLDSGHQLRSPKPTISLIP